MSAESFKRLWSWLRWPFALAVLAGLVIPNLAQLRDLVAAGVLWRWILVAVVLRATAMVLGAVRWNLLLKGQGIQLPLTRVIRLFATGYVCNFLLPGTVGGDVARAGLVATDSPQCRMRGVATVPLDRLLGLLAFIVVGATAGLLQWSTIPPGILRTSVLILTGMSVAGVLGLLALLLFPSPRRADRPSSTPDLVTGEEPALGAERRRKLGHELLLGLTLLRESKRAVLAALVIAMVGYSCLSLTYYCSLRAYPAADVPAGPLAHLWITPSAEVPVAVLPLPGGVGVREGALALLYGALTMDSVHSNSYHEVGVIVAATFSAVNVGLAILVGALLTMTASRPQRIEARQE